MGRRSPARRGLGGGVGSAVLENLSIAISCFNCDSQAGSRINVDLRVLQTVTPRGCGTPIMRVLLSFSTPPKPAKLVA